MIKVLKLVNSLTSFKAFERVFPHSFPRKTTTKKHKFLILKVNSPELIETNQILVNQIRSHQINLVSEFSKKPHVAVF